MIKTQLDDIVYRDYWDNHHLLDDIVKHWQTHLLRDGIGCLMNCRDCVRLYTLQRTGCFLGVNDVLAILNHWDYHLVRNHQHCRDCRSLAYRLATLFRIIDASMMEFTKRQHVVKPGRKKRLTQKTFDASMNETNFEIGVEEGLS
jgi:hypothetical protein